MLRLALPLAFVVLLAGCLGGGDASSEETPDAPKAGAPTANAATDPLVNASAAPQEPAPVETIISYVGRSPVGVCDFIATNACQHAQQGSEDYHLVEAPGQPTRLAVQVSYTGQAPGMDFYVGLCIGENEGVDCFEYVTGPSPVTFEADLRAYPPGTVFGLSVGSLHTAAVTVGVGVFGPADFEVVGAITSIPTA